MAIKKHFHVEELLCPHCAENIIENLEKLSFIDEVNINYDTKDITIISKKELNDLETNQVLEACLLNGHCEEHPFNHLQDIVTEEYHFEDIDCPNCAAKVERELNKDEDIIDAKVNFINKKIIITHLNNVQVYDVVSKIVGKTEHGASVTKIEDDDHEEHHHDHNHEHHHHHCDCECCNHEHEHHHKHNPKLVKILRLGLAILGAILFVTAHALDEFEIENVSTLCLIFYLVGYACIGYDIIFKSIYSIIHGDIFNENTLMLIASVGALCVSEFFEGTIVILLYKIGEYFQDKATEKSKDAIQDLMELKVDTVTLSSGEVKDVKEVNVGEIISIKVGERIPLDGVVKKGDTSLDMKTLTGESIPTYVNEGEEILSGSINLSKVIEVEVTKKDQDSTLSKVKKLVEDANNKKSSTEQFITHFARVYTPAVLTLALLVFLFQFFVLKENIVVTLNNVFTILVISCPCALVISIPLAFFAGIGRCSSSGILVKGGNYLEALNEINTFVFDKTGTITKGNFTVIDVCPVSTMTKEEMIEIVARAEQYSLHPIAKSIEACYGQQFEDEDLIAEELPGAGVKVRIEGKTVLVGNENLMKKYGIKFVKSDAVGTVLYLAIDRKYNGYIVIADEPREEAPSLIDYLKKNNIKTVILSGDKYEVAKEIADRVGVDEFYGKLLPENKYAYLKDQIAKKQGKVAYIGDGINDTPALSIADVGLAMGGAGSDSAKECADIVIMNDDLNKVKTAMEISKHTRKIILENIIFILLVKALALIVSMVPQIDLGSFGMIFAIFADVGVCLLAILNVLRILKHKVRK